MAILLILFSVFSCLYPLYCLLFYLRSQWPKWRLYGRMPGLPVSPLVGTVLSLVEYSLGSTATQLGLPVFFPLLFDFVVKSARATGNGFSYFRLGPFRHCIALFDAQAIETFLGKTGNLSKAVEYDFIKGWLGDGILTEKGSDWKQHRKLLTPAFHFEILNKFIPIINFQVATCRSIVNSRMSSSSEVASFADIRPLVANCVMDIFCQTSMGQTMNAQANWLALEKEEEGDGQRGESEYVEAVRGFLDLILYRMTRPWLYLNCLFRLSPAGRRSAHYVSVLHQFTNSVLQRRKRELEESLPADCSFEEATKQISSSKRLAFLDLLLCQHLKGGKDTLDLVQVQQDVDGFMFAGTDTTTTALQFALLLIGLNPDTQECIHEELDSIFENDTERDITLEDTKRMSYLEMAIKETMRLYPSIPFFGRTVTEEFTCEGHLIPAGTAVWVYTSAVHQDPKVYPKPEHFRPERFSPQESRGRSPFAFIPFSAGARNCLGQRYAMLQMKLFLASILREFTIRSLTQRDPILLNCFVVTKSLTPISIEFTKRNGKMASRNVPMTL